MSRNLSEFQLIEKFFKPLTNDCVVAQNLSDDVAKISGLKDDEELIISKDLAVEDTHFLALDGGFKIASKLLRTNLSDIASSGACPKYYSLGFTKTAFTDEKFMRDFSLGLKSVQDEFLVSLIGGDTISAKQLFLSLTIFGVAPKGKSLSRLKAKSGDLIFVSGTIGDAYLGLNKFFDSSLENDEKEYLLNRHFFPNPRIELGKELVKRGLSKCAADISDGLLADLFHICHSSNLSAKIYQDKIPTSFAAQKVLSQKQDEVSLIDLISGGDDYELIFTVSKNDREKVAELSKYLNLKLSCIGEFSESSEQSDLELFDSNNNKVEIKKYGYEH